jgi:lysophospholipid acyltransferase (LPLAT)-like uncharacterized protein
MRIRHPLAIKAFGFTAAWVFRSWMSTVRYRYCPVGVDIDPRRPDLGERYIYAIWHENILLPLYQFSRADVWVILSRHGDGELLNEVGRHIGLKAVRGSTNRGGVEAIRQMLRVAQRAHVAITPDGPRGPRRKIQPGLVYLSARTGLPLVPTAFGYHRPWRLNSWDRFAIPKPGTLGTCVTGMPIRVPESAGRDQLEHYRCLLEVRMHEVTELAEFWAETRELPAVLGKTVTTEANSGHESRLAG